MSLFNIKISYEKLALKLCNTYPDAIMYDNENDLNLEETTYNFAECVIRDFDYNRQKYNFGTTFSNINECDLWIQTHLGAYIYEIADSIRHINDIDLE